MLDEPNALPLVLEAEPLPAAVLALVLRGRRESNRSAELGKEALVEAVQRRGMSLAIEDGMKETMVGKGAVRCPDRRLVGVALGEPRGLGVEGFAAEFVFDPSVAVPHAGAAPGEQLSPKFSLCLVPVTWPTGELIVKAIVRSRLVTWPFWSTVTKAVPVSWKALGYGPLAVPLASKASLDSA